MRGWRLRRHRPPGIVPIEIWNWTIGGRKLYELVGRKRVESMADQPAEAIALAIGESLLPCVQEIRHRHHVDRIHVGGGLSEMPGFAEALAVFMPIPTVIDPAGRFAGEAGGIKLLRQIGVGSGVVVDVGQTAIKVSIANPVKVVRHTHKHQSSITAEELLAHAILIAAASDPGPGLALALPCELDDNGVPGPCTFPGWEGNLGIVPRILDAVMESLGDDHIWRRQPLDVLLLNDAELAACSAQIAHSVATVLVLTLGFGPGAALAQC